MPRAFDIDVERMNFIITRVSRGNPVEPENEEEVEFIAAVEAGLKQDAADGHQLRIAND